MTVSPEHDLNSIARLCELLQSSPRAIEAAAAKANIAPSLRLNGIVYFSDRNIGQIREHLNRRHEK